MNLSIPDAAVELGVSETRLRKTIAEFAVPTLFEFRQTKTGVRKAAVLDREAIARLHAHFTAPLPSFCGSGQRDSSDAPAGSPASYAVLPVSSLASPAKPIPGACHVEDDGEDRFASPGFLGEEERVPEHDLLSPEVSPATGGQTVPLTQFNALLYQHNVLRQELSRVSDYLEGCDRLLGEMVHTISTLEERTKHLDRSPSPIRGVHPLSGALRSVSASVQNALFARSATAQSVGQIRGRVSGIGCRV